MLFLHLLSQSAFCCQMLLSLTNLFVFCLTQMRTRQHLAKFLLFCLISMCSVNSPLLFLKAQMQSLNSNGCIFVQLQHYSNLLNCCIASRHLKTQQKPDKWLNSLGTAKLLVCIVRMGGTGCRFCLTVFKYSAFDPGFNSVEAPDWQVLGREFNLEYKKKDVIREFSTNPISYFA